MTGRQLTVGVIGDNTVDEYVGARSRRLIGGNALNVAVQLSRSGHTVLLASAVGPDADGVAVRCALEANGVATAALVVLDGVTSVSRIRVQPDGDRIFEHEDFGVCDDYRPTEEVLDALAQCDAVHIGMLREAEPVRRRLKEAGVPVFQDCAVTPGFSHLAVAFLSVGDTPGAAEQPARQAVSGGAPLTVVTCGAAGSHAFDGETWWFQPAVAVDPVDTTGAGDSFIAGFLAARTSGAAVAEALLRGAELAARTCTHFGGWPQ